MGDYDHDVLMKETSSSSRRQSWQLTYSTWKFNASLWSQQATAAQVSWNLVPPSHWKEHLWNIFLPLTFFFHFTPHILLQRKDCNTYQKIPEKKFKLHSLWRPVDGVTVVSSQFFVQCNDPLTDLTAELLLMKSTRSRWHLALIFRLNVNDVLFSEFPL